VASRCSWTSASVLGVLAPRRSRKRTADGRSAGSPLVACVAPNQRRGRPAAPWSTMSPEAWNQSSLPWSSCPCWRGIVTGPPAAIGSSLGTGHGSLARAHTECLNSSSASPRVEWSAPASTTFCSLACCGCEAAVAVCRAGRGGAGRGRRDLRGAARSPAVDRKTEGSLRGRCRGGGAGGLLGLHRVLRSGRGGTADSWLTPSRQSRSRTRYWWLGERRSGSRSRLSGARAVAGLPRDPVTSVACRCLRPPPPSLTRHGR
jgi:hypothetical protein